MGRYTGPACKLCRREGMKLFLKGVRCTMAKCAVERGRPSPGMHGQGRPKKMSDYGTQLREKQRLRRHYGMQEGQFRVFFDRVARKRGITGELLLQMLEGRLDSVVYRLGLAHSRRAARQFVLHGHLKVNGRPANIPSMILRPGSVIAVKSRQKSRDIATKNLEGSENRTVPPWLALDAKNLTGEFVRVPTREEIAPIVNEQLVVELYSK